MLGSMQEFLAAELAQIEESGLFKVERVIGGPQQAHISVVGGEGGDREVLNMCANNYLGLRIIRR